MIGLLVILALLIIVPVVLLITGLVFVCSNDSRVKRKGKHFLLSGALVVLIEVVIGFSVCSGLNFH